MARINPGCSHPYLPEHFLTGGNGLSLDEAKKWFGPSGFGEGKKKKALQNAVGRLKQSMDRGVEAQHFEAWDKALKSSAGFFTDDWENRWCKLFNSHPHLLPGSRGVLIQQPDGTYIPIIVVNSKGRWRRLNTTEAKLMTADPSRQVPASVPRPPEGTAHPDQFVSVDPVEARRPPTKRPPTSRPTSRPSNYQTPLAPPPVQPFPWYAVAIGVPVTLAGAGGIWWVATKKKKRA
jgi:hypothetical protein